MLLKVRQVVRNPACRPATNRLALALEPILSELVDDLITLPSSEPHRDGAIGQGIGLSSYARNRLGAPSGELRRFVLVAFCADDERCTTGMARVDDPPELRLITEERVGPVDEERRVVLVHRAEDRGGG